MPLAILLTAFFFIAFMAFMAAFFHEAPSLWRRCPSRSCSQPSSSSPSWPSWLPSSTKHHHFGEDAPRDLAHSLLLHRLHGLHGCLLLHHLHGLHGHLLLHHLHRLHGCLLLHDLHGLHGCHLLHHLHGLHCLCHCVLEDSKSFRAEEVNLAAP